MGIWAHMDSSLHHNWNSTIFSMGKGLERGDVKIAIGVLAIQLILNFFWTIIFFGFKSLLGELIGIVFLWIALIINIILFYRISKGAGILLVQYIIWVTIALYLNYTVYF